MEEFLKHDILKFKSKIIERAEQELDFTPDESRLLEYLTQDSHNEHGSDDAARSVMERSDELNLSLQERLDRAQRLVALLEDKSRMHRILKVTRQWMSEIAR